MACRHCWLAPPYDPELGSTQTLDPQLFERAIEEASPLGLQGIKLTGGEPLLHPDFDTFVAAAVARRLSLSVETNGVLMTQPRADSLARAQNVFVGVSLDGATAATHDSIRGVNGSFDAAVSAVRMLASAGVSPQIVFSLMRSNEHEIRDVVALAEELGASSVKFNVLQPFARSLNGPGYLEPLTVREYLAYCRVVNLQLQDSSSIRLHFDSPLAFHPLSQLAASGRRGICNILGVLGVLWDGHYALCGIGGHEPDLVFGRVSTDSLARIWHDSATLTKLRLGLPGDLKGICGQCVMAQLCGGSCVAQNYYRSHDLFAPFWFCDEAADQGLFPDSRRVRPGAERRGSF